MIFKWFQFSLLFFVFFFSFATQVLSDKKQWLRVTIERAEIWPTKDDGNCWDFCWNVGELPKRVAGKKYGEYLKNPVFFALQKGASAPDPYVRLVIGKQTFLTKIISDTTTPHWNSHHFVTVEPSDSWSMEVLDKEWKGEELIGKTSGKTFPLAWLKGGTFHLQNIGKVESLWIKVQPLEFQFQEPNSVSNQQSSSPPSQKMKLPDQWVIKLQIKGCKVAAQKKDGQEWDGKKTWTVLRRLNWTQTQSLPDVFLQLQIGESKWKTQTLSNHLEPQWNYSLVAKITKDTPIRLTVWDADWLSNEKIGDYKSIEPRMIWYQGGEWITPSFGQVEHCKFQIERLPLQEKPAQVLFASILAKPSVRFVEVEILKADVWPLKKGNRCWDSCPFGSFKNIPPRGLASFKDYWKDDSFREAFQGNFLPDPKVRIQIGEFEIHYSRTQENTLEPVWNSKHLFRLTGKENIHITVFDDDDNAVYEFLKSISPTKQFLLQWNLKDLMGEYKLARLPAVFQTGGVWELPAFGSVERFSLKVISKEERAISSECDGVYRVRLSKLEIQKKRKDGKDWHQGPGSFKNPSPYATLWLGNQSLETSIAYKTVSPIYQDSRLFPIKKDTSFVLEVKDYNVGIGLSMDQSYKIPFLPFRVQLGVKKDPSLGKIGQIAFLSACELLKRAKNGQVRLAPFGQVQSAILFFDKVGSR